MFFRDVIQHHAAVQLDETKTFAKLGVGEKSTQEEWFNDEKNAWDGEGVGKDYYEYYFGDLSTVKMLETLKLDEK